VSHWGGVVGDFYPFHILFLSSYHVHAIESVDNRCPLNIKGEKREKKGREGWTENGE
jgi:hypothetical protein